MVFDIFCLLWFITTCSKIYVVSKYKYKSCYLFWGIGEKKRSEMNFSKFTTSKNLLQNLIQVE